MDCFDIRVTTMVESAIWLWLRLIATLDDDDDDDDEWRKFEVTLNSTKVFVV